MLLGNLGVLQLTMLAGLASGSFLSTLHPRSVSRICAPAPGFGPSCAQRQPIRIWGTMRGLIPGFGEMKGKTLIKISFKTHQDFVFFFNLIQISSHPEITL